MPAAERPTPALLQQAWELAYLDPPRAAALGRGLAERGDRDAGWGWVHVALAEARGHVPSDGGRALDLARAVFQQDGDHRGLALVDEVRAIVLRRRGEVQASARLQREIDSRSGIAYKPEERFVAHNSRAFTQRLLGAADRALQHFYAASDAAHACGWAGMRITALSNLGGYHHELFNLEEARLLCEQAVTLALKADVRDVAAATSANLIAIHHAAGHPLRAHEAAHAYLAQQHRLPADAPQQHALALALGFLAGGEVDTAQHWLDRGAPAAVGNRGLLATWAWLQARCAMRRGDTVSAHAVTEHALRELGAPSPADQPYDRMELLQAAADACEQLGDVRAALTHARAAHALYVHLVRHSAQARQGALQAQHEVAAAQRERDQARDSHRSAEADRHRLSALNDALRHQMAETEMLHAQLREQALRDALTGLHNRRHLFEAGPGLLELARRHERPLTLVLLDLDHFKLLNDTYGHQAGDTVLQHFAGLLRSSFRRSDVVCRHGGEEFVALMPDIDADGASAFMERLQQAYQAQPLTHGRRRLPSCSFSAGVAVFPAHGHTLEQLLSRADKALYSAKQLGRARVERVAQTDFTTFT